MYILYSSRLYIYKMYLLEIGYYLASIALFNDKTGIVLKEEMLRKYSRCQIKSHVSF